MSTTISPPAVQSSDRRQDGPSVHSGLGPLLRRLHFYAGVLVAPFLLLVAITGLLYAFTPQFDEIAYHDQLHVTATGGEPIALSRQVSAAQDVVPGGTVSAIHLAADPAATTKVEFSLPELESKQRTVYVDPYTGSIRGVLTTQSGATPITSWLSELHSSLHLGEPGRLYSELAASWLWVLVAGGLVLWWRHQRGKRLSRRLLVPETAARKGVRRSRSWHAVTGIWIAGALVFLSATGLTWSQHAGANFDLLRSSLNSDSIPLKTGLGATTGAASEEHHSSGHTGAASGNLDAIAASAAKAGLSGPVTISPATKPGLAWTVSQTDNTWPVHRDKIAVHPGTGEVTDTVRWADQPLLSQLTSLGIQLHMGVLFGLANQAGLALIAIGLITIIVWGYHMWWQRRPARGLGTPPVRGMWRQLPVPGVAAVAGAAIAIGWAVPLLGWTLLGFLVFDAVVGKLRHTQQNG